MNPSVPCFRKTPVAIKFMDKRGEFQDFLSKTFCLTEPKKSVGEGGILWCFINFGYRKNLNKRGGEYQEFQSQIFCLTVPKISVGETFTVALISGAKKVWIR